ncbi:unnamed protein product [Diplocarpon coronariae]
MRYPLSCVRLSTFKIRHLRLLGTPGCLLLEWLMTAYSKLRSQNPETYGPPLIWRFLVSCLSRVFPSWIVPVITHLVLGHFHLLDELPVEIRLAIWGRVVLFSRKIKLLESNTLASHTFSPTWSCNAEGQEAGREGLRYYKLCKGEIRCIPCYRAYNFPPDVIQHIQHLDKMPVYLVCHLSSEDIKGYPIHEALRFRRQVARECSGRPTRTPGSGASTTGWSRSSIRCRENHLAWQGRRRGTIFRRALALVLL